MVRSLIESVNIATSMELSLAQSGEGRMRVKFATTHQTRYVSTIATNRVAFVDGFATLAIVCLVLLEIIQND
jgi:hypothetical protein